MIEIRFEEENDARMMYELIRASIGDGYEHVTVSVQQEAVLIHISNEAKRFAEEVIIPAFVRFIIDVKEDKWIISILEKSFLYQDYEEQQQILHIAHSLLEGKRKDIPCKALKEEREHLLATSLQEFMEKPISFSFSSYARFRLKPYMVYLFHLTEAAIDEYKLEQDYQAFVEMLRQHVYKRTSRLSCLHIVYNGKFIFYDDQGLRLNQERLVQYIDETIACNQQLYIDTNVIAPLLSIAPKTIYLYTAHTDHNMIVTIRNVFQERVVVHSIGEFEKMVRK